jgi:hypothetical protein
MKGGPQRVKGPARKLGEHPLDRCPREKGRPLGDRPTAFFVRREGLGIRVFPEVSHYLMKPLSKLSICFMYGLMLMLVAAGAIPFDRESFFGQAPPVLD